MNPPVRNREKSIVWLVVYSDLITNLMLFFLILFASTRLSAERPGDVALKVAGSIPYAPAETKNARERADRGEAEAEARELAKGFAKQGVKLEEAGEGVTLVFPAAGLFDSGRAELKERTRAMLDGLAPVLAKYPHSVVIEGHTDDRPVARGSGFRSNWELSFARAHAVLRYLASERGVDRSKMIAVGRSFHDPADADANATAEGRARNRRIEIKLREGADYP